MLPDASDRAEDDTASRAIRPGGSRNAGRLLDILRAHGPMGRRHLAAKLGVTGQTVGNLVDPLLAAGWIRALGPARAGRGKPGERYALNPDGAISIGYEIARGGVNWVVMDLSGQLRLAGRLAIADSAPASVLPLLAEHSAGLRGGFVSPLAGIGVVAPGPFGPLRRRAGSGAAAAWSGPDPIAPLRAVLDVPVSLDNDANAAALAEALFGAGARMSDFLTLYFGAGLGLGIVASGRPLRGAFGNAGEIGLMIPAGRSEPLDALAPPAAMRAGPGNGRAEAAWIARAAPPLAQVVSMLEDIFDPEGVIVTGDLPMGTADRLCAAIMAQDGGSAARLIAGTAGPLTAAMGAAALPLFDVLTARSEGSEAFLGAPAGDVGGSG